MAWTYDSSLGSDRDKLRLLVGDTDSTEELLDDGALDFLLTAEASTAVAYLDRVAASACRAIAAKFARRVDFDQGGAAIKASDRSKRYSALAAEFQARVDAAVLAAAGNGAGGGVPRNTVGRPVVGGLFVNLDEARRNRVQDPVGRGEGINPATGAPW